MAQTATDAVSIQVPTPASLAELIAQTQTDFERRPTDSLSDALATLADDHAAATARGRTDADTAPTVDFRKLDDDELWTDL